MIEARALNIGAPLYRWGHEWRCYPHPPATDVAGPSLSHIAGEGAFGRSPEAGEGEPGMRYESERWRLDLPLPSLPGEHQIVNAGIALACLERLDGFALPETALAAGLRHIDWPARMQRLTQGPLAEILPPGWELWLDGGHNPGAGQVLAEAVSAWRDRPLYLVVGMLNTKDASGFLTPLEAHARALCAVTIPGEENALPAARIAAAARALGIAAEEAASVETALRSIVARAIVNREAGPARVLICGSLHLAGIVLAENG